MFFLNVLACTVSSGPFIRSYFRIHSIAGESRPTTDGFPDYNIVILYHLYLGIQHLPYQVSLLSVLARKDNDNDKKDKDREDGRGAPFLLAIYYNITIYGGYNHNRNHNYNHIISSLYF